MLRRCLMLLPLLLPIMLGGCVAYPYGYGGYGGYGYGYYGRPAYIAPRPYYGGYWGPRWGGYYRGYRRW